MNELTERLGFFYHYESLNEELESFVTLYNSISGLSGWVCVLERGGLDGE